jgi:hypothetical protein
MPSPNFPFPTILKFKKTLENGYGSFELFGIFAIFQYIEIKN